MLLENIVRYTTNLFKNDEILLAINELQMTKKRKHTEETMFSHR